MKNYEVSTNYTYIAIKRESRLQLKLIIGKWNEESCLEFWSEIKKRFVPATAKDRFNACTDGNKQNLSALQTVFVQGAVNYAKFSKGYQASKLLSAAKEHADSYQKRTDAPIWITLLIHFICL